MGVVISTGSSLAPISIVSIVIGFVSFAFTLGTFFKVVWINLETLSEPAHGVHTLLNNLREELLEERASLRVLRKANKDRRKHRKKLPESLNLLLNIELDEVTLKTMSDSMRHLIREFEDLERPFLRAGEDGMRQARRRSIRRKEELAASVNHEHAAYGTPPFEKRARQDSRTGHDADSEEDMYWAQRVQYGRYDFRKRLIWLYKKSTAQNLYETLSRMQTRRIARQVNGIGIMLRGYGDSVVEVEDRLDQIGQRLNRVIGVRRIDTS